MLKSRLLLFFCLISSFTALNAQKTVWSSFQKYNGGNATLNIIGETNEGMLALRYSDRNLKKNVFIDYYDFSMRLRNTVGIGMRKQQLEKILLFKNRHAVCLQINTCKFW